jgi:AcrR family transcriptional regulator
VKSVSVLPKRERNAQETQRRILAAAEVEFASKGFDGARLGNIARAAGVQQALIHHYFEDKVGLYRGVVVHAIGAMSLEGWSVLQRLGTSLERVDLREIIEAFYDPMMAFSLKHGKVLAILRHATTADPHGHGGRAEVDVDEIVRSTLAEKSRPIFDAVVELLERLQQSGQVNPDVNPRHLCISAIAMIWAAVQDEAVVQALWPTDLRSPAFLDDRKREVCATILARVTMPR